MVPGALVAGFVFRFFTLICLVVEGLMGGTSTILKEIFTWEMFIRANKACI